MTDEASTTTTQQPAAPKKDTSVGNNHPAKGGRGGKRTNSQSHSGSAQGNQGQRPSSRSSNNKSESGSQRKGNGNSNKSDRGKNQREGGGRGGKRTNNANGQAGHQGGVPITQATKATDESDALQNLQRMITDLKSISPPSTFPLPSGSPPMQTNTISNSMSNISNKTTLPPNAPVFQPGASAYPGPSASEVPPRHRKAASLGAGPPPMLNAYSSYSPNLGSMTEDSESGNLSYEDGEIADVPSFHPGHQPRAQSQNFTAPRFAALAQQEQNENLGPSGRPQLAPTFVFGARRRGSTNPPALGPAISEEDSGFQFPQQHQEAYQPGAPTEHRRTNSGGEITGIMAEQVQLTKYSRYANINSKFYHRWLYKVKLKPFSNNKQLCISNSSPPISY